MKHSPQAYAEEAEIRVKQGQVQEAQVFATLALAAASAPVEEYEVAPRLRTLEGDRAAFEEWFGQYFGTVREATTFNKSDVMMGFVCGMDAMENRHG